MPLGLPTNPSNKHLFFDQLWENSNNTCLISMQGVTNSETNDIQFDSKTRFLKQATNKPLQFFINGAMSFSGANQYEAPLENAFNEIKKYTGILNVLGSEISALKNIPTLQIRTELQTVLQWVNSDRKSFTIPVFFVKWKREHSTVDYLKILELATSPSRIENSSFKDLIAVAPGGGQAINNKEIKSTGGKVAIKIGKWFEADQLVFSNYNMSVAQETDENGETLWIEGSVTFTASKIFDGKTVASWLKKV